MCGGGIAARGGGALWVGLVSGQAGRGVGWRGGRHAGSLCGPVPAHCQAIAAGLHPPTRSFAPCPCLLRSPSTQINNYNRAEEVRAGLAQGGRGWEARAGHAAGSTGCSPRCRGAPHLRRRHPAPALAAAHPIPPRRSSTSSTWRAAGGLARARTPPRAAPTPSGATAEGPPAGEQQRAASTAPAGACCLALKLASSLL